MTAMMRTAPRDGVLLAALTGLLLVAALCTAAVTGHRAEIQVLVREGKPREVAECMVQLRHSWGECEIGMFTGTYPAAWDSVADLVPVRDAVRALRARGGEWTFANHVSGRPWSVCAGLPGRAPACATNVRSALRVALGEAAAAGSPSLAVAPDTRRLCSSAAAAALRRRAADGDALVRAEARRRLASRASACGIRTE